MAIGYSHTINPQKTYTSLPIQLNLNKSYFLIVGSNTRQTALSNIDNNVIIEGIWQDIAQLKLLLSSDLINFNKENIEVLFAPTKNDFKNKIDFFLEPNKTENLFLFFSVPTAVNYDTDDFEIGLGENEIITTTEIYNCFGKTEINLIIFFDGDKGERFFESFYKRNTFILSSVGKDQNSIDTKDGGILAQCLSNVINKGIDNDREYLTLSEIFIAIREQQYQDFGIEPKLFTTNLVQYLIFAKNKKFNQNNSIKKISINSVKELIEKNHLEAALKALKEVQIVDEDLKKGIFILSQQYYDFRKADILGILEAKTTKYADFSWRLLNYLDLIEK